MAKFNLPKPAIFKPTKSLHSAGGFGGGGDVTNNITNNTYCAGDPFGYSATTNPSGIGIGVVRFNSTTFGSITKMYVSDNDQNAVDLVAEQSIMTSGVAKLYKAEGGKLSFQVTRMVDQSGYFEYDVLPLSGSMPTVGEVCYVDFVPDAKMRGNTLFVDSVYGNDDTAAREEAGRPFLTLTAAKTAAQSGDTIVVRPGIYNERGLVKAGVRWHFELGAEVRYSGADAGGDPALFYITGDVLDLYVTGYGRFEWAAGDAGYILYGSQFGNISGVFEGIDALSDGTGVIGFENTALLDFSVYLDNMTSENDTIYFAAQGGVLRVECNHIDGSATTIIHEGQGDLFVTSRVIVASKLAVNFAAGGALNITCPDMQFTGAHGIDHQSGSDERPTRVSGRIYSTTTTGIPCNAQTDGLELHECQLVAGSSATKSIDAAAAVNVVSFGSYANVAADGDVTVSGSLTVGAYVK